MLLTIQIINVI